MKTVVMHKKSLHKGYKNKLTPFILLVSFSYPMKTSENHRFSDFFRGHTKKPVV